VGIILSLYEEIEALEGERLETVKGRLLKNPKGLCIEQRADGFTRKVYIE
jgi:hypothetical protein